MLFYFKYSIFAFLVDIIHSHVLRLKLAVLQLDEELVDNNFALSKNKTILVLLDDFIRYLSDLLIIQPRLGIIINVISGSKRFVFKAGPV